jgi:hypothetical protein
MNGDGTVLNLLFEAIAPGNALLSFSQGTIRDVTQTSLPGSFSSTQLVVK